MTSKYAIPSTTPLERLRTLTRTPAFAIAALVVGLGLIFGGQLLAGGHDEAAPAEHADDHGDATHGDEGHGDGHEEGGVEHPPNLVTILAGLLEGEAVHDAAHAHNPIAKFLLHFQPVIFSLIVLLIIVWIFRLGTRGMELIPGPMQNFVEWVVESLESFVMGVIGPQGTRFVPFIGSLFIYVYMMNIIGLFPLGYGATSMLETTAALALVVFVYVQWTGIRSNGLGGYVKHLAGDPQSPVEKAMVPLIFPLHVIGEIAKPISLSLRLFGNILGGETLLAVFMGLGVGMLAFTNLPVGVPLQTPFIFLELLVTFIQALVFSLLATIYFALVLPHEEHH